MVPQSVSLLLVLVIAATVSHARPQQGDIFFPGPTSRPERYPLPTRPNGSRQDITPPPTLQTTVQPPFQPVTNPQNPVSVEAYNSCVASCMTTSEYNPVCATDGVVYSNPGRLNCAINCGNPIQLVGYGQCTSNSRGR